MKTQTTNPIQTLILLAIILTGALYLGSAFYGKLKTLAEGTAEALRKPKAEQAVRL